ncbi:uncharacterized protein M6G45_006762 isoform 1-T1 [Spheniscus humboldti]
MRLPELCLALLCAAAAGTGSPGAAREQSPGPGAAAGRASEAGRGAPGPAAPRTSGVDLRQTWMLLAGSPGRASGSRARGRTGTGRDGTGAGRASIPASGQSPGKSPQAALQVGVPGAAAAPAGAPAVLEPLLRELQLLLKGMVKEKAKTCRKAWEGREEEEESGEGNAQARSHCRVEAAFHCRTRENISIKQRARQELRLYYIMKREGMFHHGLGLNLTSRQYTAPVAGYYTFTATLHIGWAVCLCFCGQRCRLSPHHSKWLRFQRHSARGVKRCLAPHRELNLLPGAAGPFPVPATVTPPLLSTKPREDLPLLQKLQAGPILLALQNHLKLDKRSGRKG